MNESLSCPKCGAVLPGTGICAACAANFLQGEPTVAPGEPFVPPSVAELAEKFPQLEIFELIGKGGMGAVYRARQRELDRIVALKILPPGIGDDPAFAERFAREARALAKLSHPNIVTLFEFGRAEDGPYFFLMEFVDGVNLRQLLHAERISPREALEIVPQICDALQFAHDHGIVHRDIKPENILLDRRGRVKVADFGLAKLIGTGAEAPGEGIDAHADLTGAGKILGTPSYMAPEQTVRPDAVDHRADIYALGVVFYQMLTGELPTKNIEPPSRCVRIDVRLDEVVLRALEQKPERRYQQASVLKTQVEIIAQDEKSEVGNPRSEMASRFSRTAVVGAAVAICSPLLWFVLPFVATLLGWIAVSQIRRSAGKIYGLWLAVFDGLLFPLLALDALIGGSWMALMKVVFHLDRQWIPVAGLLALATIAWVDYVLIRRVWRAANQPVDQSATAAARRSPRKVIAWALVVVAVLGLAAGVFSTMKAKRGAEGVGDIAIAKNGATTLPGREANGIPVAAHPGHTGDAGVFGPVIERVVNKDGMIDFDTGKIVAELPESVTKANDLAENVLDAFAWMEREGMDAMSMQGGLLSEDGFKGLDMKIKALAPEEWDRLAAEQLPAILASTEIRKWQTLLSDKKIPQTCAFQTREGGMGILQITGFTENPTQVKLRYKLVQTAKDASMDSTALRNRLIDLELETARGRALYREENPARRQLEAELASFEKAHPNLRDAAFFELVTQRQAALSAESAKLAQKFAAGNPERAALQAKLDALQHVLTGRTGDTEPATSAVQAWLALMDGGQYAQAWQASSDGFRQTVTQEGWVTMSQAVRGPLGAVISRKSTSTQQMPAGPGTAGSSYIVTKFDTSFATMPAAVETVTFTLEKDGQWKAAAYLILPRSDGSKEAEEKAAVGAAETWLAGVDAGNYSQSWKDAAASFRAAVTEEGWTAAATSVRKPLGALVFRKLKSAQDTKSLPGAPDGEYVFMQFDTSFAAKKSAIETVTFMLEKDGQWRAAGYFVR